MISLSTITEVVRKKVNDRLRSIVPAEPRSLYDPVRYVLEAGGKRLRPVLTRCASISSPHESWLAAATAVELLHTFTLVHDDIMDNAATRRGVETVHERYDVNTAILSGDVLIALAEESLAEAATSGAMLAEFAKGFRYVCEGQALDKEFELRDNVTTDDYFTMIDLKSAKLLELAAVLGGLVAGDVDIEALRTFAHHLGLAFQLRDDLLDLTAGADFGKTIGGDIIEGKRTFLLIRTLEQLPSMADEDKRVIGIVSERKATAEHITVVRDLMLKVGVIAETEREIARHTSIAQDALKAVEQESVRSALLQFSDYLLQRTT